MNEEYGLKMPELVMIFCLFCALPDVGALIAAFVHRKDLKNAKVISTLGYVYRMKEAGLTNETMPLNDEDVERLKRRHSVIAGLVTLPITLSAMGSLMIILGFQNNPDVSNLIVIGLFVLGILMGVTTGVVVYRMLKQNNDCKDYTKRRGVCLDLVVRTIGAGAKKAPIYYATVGYISDDGTPVVFKLQITDEIYYAMKYAKGWFVVVESNNRNMNVITEKTLDEMIREDRANSIERHFKSTGIYSGYYD